MQQRQRIDELEKLVKHHQQLYYNGQPVISDAEFDALWDELSVLHPASPVLAGIGSDAADGFQKARHILPMGSQAKAADPDEFMTWCAKVKHPDYVVELKMDGASLELQYEAGRLARAITRGDGTIGDDITANARRMTGVPQRLAGAWSGSVRGEVLMSRAVLREHFSDKANCRNAANGLMKRKDGIGTEYLDVLCYDAAPRGVFDQSEVGAAPAELFGTSAVQLAMPAPFDDEISKLEWLASSGFRVVDYQVFSDPFAIIDYRARIVAERQSMPYDVDGLVVKGRRVDVDDLRRARPELQIAFKFPLEEAISVLRAVEWSETGASYTPIAIIDPVRLAGTSVKRANLANTNTIKGMGLKIGSRVIVVKRGEIIPKIEGLVENPDGTTAITAPATCSCGTTLVDEGTRLFCPNRSCSKKALHRLEKWIAVLNIMEFGMTILKRLFDSGRVKTIADLYSLEPAELATYERMGATSARKLVDNLRTRTELSLAEFVAGFDIEGIGLLMVEKALAAGFDTLEKMRSASQAELALIDGFGDITAGTLLEGLREMAAEMDAVLAGGVITIRGPNPSAGPLTGMSFCFTGELVSMKRSKAEALVKARGGTIRSSVTRDLSYLVSNDQRSASTKSRRASELGIPILDEAGLLALLDGQPGG